MTQAQVATALGHPQSYIAKIEGGERRLDVVELVDLADVIGLDLHKLVTTLRTVSHS
ncbi:MAG: helix-turn-helix transcriptional regulator [Devosia sp.]|nr:helix-turn-helix transcriptional regulator [Devosia sp.]